MKKHFPTIIVCVMLFILFCSCSVKSENTETILYRKGLELIQRMDMMGESEE